MSCLRCELYGLTQDRQPSLGVFFHVAALPQTASILPEQLRVIAESGLMQWTERSYATIAGWDGSQQVLDYRRQLEDAGFTETIAEPRLTRWEFPTVRTLWEHCLRTRSNKHFVLYLHTKGASKAGDPDAAWRRELMSFAVQDWRLRVRELDGGRLTSGPRYLSYGCGEPASFVAAHGHYSGNIWWAASDYVSWLPDPEQFHSSRSNRYAAEAWIGQHPGINRLRSELSDR
jgi:hypothetical protein